MCIKDEKMTNSQVLQLIIQELNQTPISWDGDKELFELICAPILYGNESYQKLKSAKQNILNIFQASNKFNQKRFHTLANNIVSGENEDRYKQELLYFLHKQIKMINISTQVDIKLLIKEIPCKTGDEKNYKTSFNNWKKGKTERINSQIIKKRLEQNFDFPSALWDKGEMFIKGAIRDGVAKFVKQHTCEIIDIFDELRKEFNMKTTITDDEIKKVEAIRQMHQTEVMEFIAKQYPLAKNSSQEFILRIIPILYGKGHYELLLHDIIPALDIHLQNIKQIIKIKAHILGSSVIGEYLKAFDLLSTITSNNDTEIIDMQTEAISNMRRHQLSYTELSKEQKKEIIKKIISHYKKIFEHNKTYHYYPAINLVYMMIISSLLDDNEQEQHLNIAINSIHEKTKPSIKIDKKSNNSKNRYYANITELEFMLLKNTGSPIAELERFLDMNKENLPIVELGRTQRQIGFFVATIISLYGNNTPMIERMQRAIEVIDDFTEYGDGI